MIITIFVYVMQAVSAPFRKGTLYWAADAKGEDGDAEETSRQYGTLWDAAGGVALGGRL
jgi:hypothetical protein